MEIPRQVLLLGNGLNRAFGGDSWSNLLETISQRSDFDISSLTSPKKNILSKFCPECGFKKPELKPLTWDCPVCGAKSINGKFCPECGNKRGE